MTRILAIADEVDDALYEDSLQQLKPDLMLSAGDLPFDYLENLVARAGVPLLYLPGNPHADGKFRRNTYRPVGGEETIPRPRGRGNAGRQIIPGEGHPLPG